MPRPPLRARGRGPATPAPVSTVSLPPRPARLRRDAAGGAGGGRPGVLSDRADRPGRSFSDGGAGGGGVGDFFTSWREAAPRSSLPVGRPWCAWWRPLRVLGPAADGDCATLRRGVVADRPGLGPARRPLARFQRWTSARDTGLVCSLLRARAGGRARRGACARPEAGRDAVRRAAANPSAPADCVRRAGGSEKETWRLAVGMAGAERRLAPRVATLAAALMAADTKRPADASARDFSSVARARSTPAPASPRSHGRCRCSRRPCRCP